MRELYEADFHKPGIYDMEAGEYGLTRGTCVFARRPEVVALAGLLRLSWCVLGGVDFFVFFFSTFFFLRTHAAYCKYEATSCLIYISTGNEAVFAFRQKSLFIPCLRELSNQVIAGTLLHVHFDAKP